MQYIYILFYSSSYRKILLGFQIAVIRLLFMFHYTTPCTMHDCDTVIIYMYSNCDCDNVISR